MEPTKTQLILRWTLLVGVLFVGMAAWGMHRAGSRQPNAYSQCLRDKYFSENACHFIYRDNTPGMGD